MFYQKNKSMKIKELVEKNRSYRRFFENEPIGREALEAFVDVARLAPSGRNLQPLKYKLVSSSDLCSKIFPHLAWAGYLKDWNGPEEGERPTGYIIQVLDLNIADHVSCDEGLQLQTLLLAAVEQGFGGCIIKAFNKKEVAKILGLSERYEPLYVVALGKPKEEVVIEFVSNDDIKYWRDEKGVHHVPKRGLEEVLLP